MTRGQLPIILLLLLSAFPCMAQKQGNIWYFGDHVGLDFNSSPPAILTDGQTYLVDGHNECSAVISDPEGKLLFYTNGEKVWNRHHRVMPNGDGLLGSYSSTSGALIVPKPWNDHLYYLFTTDAFYPDGLKDGLRYSVVDICRDGGEGDVVPEEKNVQLLATAGEKLSATMHANGRSVWIVTHEYGTDAFYAYLLSWRGIVDTVVSHIGSRHRLVRPDNPMSQTDAIGQMKISPDGRHLALCNGNSDPAIAPAVVELFDFDNATGKVSGYVNLAAVDESTIGDPYGIAFSPNGRMLYVSRRVAMLQFDVAAGDSGAIARSALRVSPPFDPNTNMEVGYGMQLGPDGRIYSAAVYAFLETINSPDVRGIGCGYTRKGVDLNKRLSSMSLPGFIDSYTYGGTAQCVEQTWMTLWIPDTVAKPGDRIELPIRIAPGTDPLPHFRKRFTATLRFERSMLIPASPGVEARIDGPDQLVTFAGEWDGRSATVGQLPVIVALGDGLRTPVTLHHFAWNDDLPYVTIPGSVEITGVCLDGGPRLIGEAPAAALKASPEPLRGASTIEVSLPETGMTRLALVDAAGRTVGVLLDAELRAGVHAVYLAADRFPSGSYLLVLETPTERIARPLMIVR